MSIDIPFRSCSSFVGAVEEHQKPGQRLCLARRGEEFSRWLWLWQTLTLMTVDRRREEPEEVELQRPVAHVENVRNSTKTRPLTHSTSVSVLP
jgi:hypothetical protein